ncbi:pentapeptide repeat-containing protein [Rivularia sp. UHCC 0363]|uniref:pentapeptide repeat-containing protein n=1 Tax=Rivularia sp. UHCC 0363 TaxID=3110244 RepID=UPI002B1FC303|nr:pentapeptide repeat-containing protein [Rivularia sp. UHCC 0363]MEA5597642.1 pentapeptide repeat-containing protein [Rivularia sp. UHCC 0363]
MPKLISICTLFLLFLLSIQPVWATETQPQRTILTLELLQERINSPIVNQGSLTVDLREMMINLEPDNQEFRDNFYQLLQAVLQKTGTKPVGLDLSDSIIEGDFIGSDLGLRTPLYAQAIAPIFTETEQSQLELLREVCLQSLAYSVPNSQDCRSLLGKNSTTSAQISVFRGSLIFKQTRFKGEVEFDNTFFLQPVEAEGAIFNQAASFTQSRFGRRVSFAGANFRREANFEGSVFFEEASFKEAQFQKITEFKNTTFEDTANFSNANFKQLANFSRARWEGTTNFSQARFLEQVQFTKANFQGFLFLKETIFTQSVIFREAQFSLPVNMRGAGILTQADFSDAVFTKAAYLNVPSLIFNADKAKILGNPGEIGAMLRVPRLSGNQNVLRNLIQNFRQLQQIADANELEYSKQQLHLKNLTRRLVDANINGASEKRLINLGFSQVQAEAIIKRRQTQSFQVKSELLTLAEIDEATFTQLASRFVVGETLTPIKWLLQTWEWLVLSLLLLLSGYGTNFYLVFGVGIIAIAFFSLLFWLVDRFRRLHPNQIVPTAYETTWMLGSFIISIIFGLVAVFRNTPQPWLTLTCITVIIIPLPGFLLFRLYQKGRYHDLMETSYFTEDGTLRQLRLLIGRLPVIPRYPLFRERYLPLLWNRRWNWLNYYDFSLNNLLKLGFNDVRLRDEHLPGIISTLAWYQWSLGILYITLVLWTLSRTIPGLNLLIYLK